MAKNITSVVWSATGLPSGLTINSSTGVISGTPNVQPPQTITATVKVVTNYDEDSKTITIKVEVPQAWKPLITEGQVITITADEAMTAYEVKGTNVKKTS